MKLNNKKIRDVIKAIMDDFNGFFIDNTKDFIKYIFEDNYCVTFKGVDNNRRISICHNIEISINEEKDKDVLYLYILIMITHEIAHYINNHNKEIFDDIDKEVESWADFIGGKIAICILKCGSKFVKFFDSKKREEYNLYLCLLKALKITQKQIFSSSYEKKYHNERVRAMQYLSGLIIGLVRYSVSLTFGIIYTVNDRVKKFDNDNIEKFLNKTKANFETVQYRSALYFYTYLFMELSVELHYDVFVAEDNDLINIDFGNKILNSHNKFRDEYNAFLKKIDPVVAYIIGEYNNNN